MTENNEDQNENDGQLKLSFTAEEVSLAQAQEQAELSAVTENHLKHRVTVLRATVNKLQSENQELKSKIPPEESSTDNPD